MNSKSIRSVLIKSCMETIQKEVSQLEHWLINLTDEPEISYKMNSKPIRSVLIKSCMATIQKDVSQLEHWLINLTDEPEISEKSHVGQNIDKLSEQLSNQQLILNNILERLDKMEGFQNSNRDVFIDVWSGNSDIDSEPLYMINKKEVADVCDEVNEINVVLNKMDNMVEEIGKVEQLVAEVDEAVNKLDEVVDNVLKEVEEVEEVEEIEELVDNVLKEEVEEVEEVEEEEEEEEGVELEEITYNGNTYYKDPEKFIYSIINGELSENPVGYWKERAQIIAFYK